MTNIAFLPNALLKEVTGTDYHLKIPSFFNDNHDLKELDRKQGRAFALENHPSWRNRRDPVSSLTDVPTNLPWWLACHRERYPYWFGRPDPRNEQLLKAMQSGERKQGSNTFRISDIILQINMLLCPVKLKLKNVWCTQFPFSLSPNPTYTVSAGFFCGFFGRKLEKN